MSTTTTSTAAAAAIDPSQGASQGITEEEAALYDRQIRLWGLDAQQRLRNSRIRVAGLKSPIALELCKNLVLAGIGQLFLMDNRLVEASDLTTLYCCLGDEACVGTKLIEVYKKYLQTLNPRVIIIPEDLATDELQSAHFETAHLTCLVDSTPANIIRVAQCYRDHTVNQEVPRSNDSGSAVPPPNGLLTSGAYGEVGYIFADLHIFTYKRNDPKTTSPPQPKSASPETAQPTNTKVQVTYPALEAVLSRGWSEISERQLKRKLSPVWLAVTVLWQFEMAKESTGLVEESQLGEFKSNWLNERGLPPNYIPDELLGRLRQDWTANPSVPVGAILGGVLAQECIKVVAGNEPALHNVFVFDGEHYLGVTNNV
ncbi:hypothetical protein BJ085DRAFT_39928 [Dimargaris cristalligena]|uniref:THIF-type NAD/FAD binding fold domain-containing protein n=1 Tax=Dimargaris cristalligena TaxID=215637 RepID=A0A4P9ZU28_9FUNG|nr:hypothetical protein BJ085DRAFT_39928 [Dimargaris cristalligena]|eukprot:RKP37045.1 hypothetical protein BJ085DRAFT_39928 [Dimargaris cristalligena]